MLVVHPGGPYWTKKDEGAWTIPKGELETDEEPLFSATREFTEETGGKVCGPFIPLGSVKQKSGKQVHAWAAEGDLDAENIRSNTFSLEWPPRSGQRREFPEVDKACWFSIHEARAKMKPEQLVFLERLQEMLKQQAAGRLANVSCRVK